MDRLAPLRSGRVRSVRCRACPASSGWSGSVVSGVVVVGSSSNGVLVAVSRSERDARNGRRRFAVVTSVMGVRSLRLIGSGSPTHVGVGHGETGDSDRRHCGDRGGHLPVPADLVFQLHVLLLILTDGSYRARFGRWEGWRAARARRPSGGGIGLFVRGCRRCRATPGRSARPGRSAMPGRRVTRGSRSSVATPGSAAKPVTERWPARPGSPAIGG